MTNLLKLQREFAHHIFDKSAKKILGETIHSDQETLQRLNIYRNNVLGNFDSVLSSIFTVTKKILGEKKFDKLSEKYSQKFPSISGDLNEFGLQFPNLLKGVKPLFLEDLAWLELFYHQSYFAAKNENKFDLKSFKKLKENEFEKIKFELNPNCILLSSKFSVFSIWQKEQKLKNFSKAEFMAIHSNKVFSLSELDFQFLSLVKKKNSLYKIYQNISKTNKEADLGSLVNRFIANETITKFSL